MDVMSNLPFLLVGLLGFFEIRRQLAAGQFQEKSEKWPYLLFFIGVFLTGLGSAYYHWMPGNPRLVWDRLPMTMVIMSLVSIILMEKAGTKIGIRALGPLLAVGFASVAYWIWTEAIGQGDLRFYGFVLFYPVALIPLILYLFPKPVHGINELVKLGLFYALAKFFEAKDEWVYSVTGVISGHTLKHLLAAMSVYWIMVMLQHRGKIRFQGGLK